MLGGLIRLHRWTLDEKRRALTDLEEFAGRLADEIGRLEAELEREMAAAGTAAVPPVGFEAYVRQVRLRQEKIRQSIRQADQQMEAARDDIAAAFRELKKYEIADAERQQKAAEEVRHREMLAYDETALSQFRRREGEET